MSAPDFNPEDEEQIVKSLEGEFTRPCAIFQNKPLWPFTPGSKALYRMSLCDQDTTLYRVLAFILIHIRRDGKDMEADLAKSVVPLIWNNLDLFRMRALALANEMQTGDMESAFGIVEKELELEKKSEITATPPASSGAQKKSTGETSRRKSAGQRTARPRKST